MIQIDSSPGVVGVLCTFSAAGLGTLRELDSESGLGWTLPRRVRTRQCVGIAYASLACSLSLWPLLALFYLQTSLHFKLPGWDLLAGFTGWTWLRFETFAVFLAIVATILRSKLWRVALLVSFLMFLLSYYIMGS